MAALTRPAQTRVRAAAAGEGRTIAALWRELWDAHETWGGYPGSRDPRVYAELAHRLDDDARIRAGHPVLGRHIHLVADYGGLVCGQVEGWFERHGAHPTTPFTCEVRSLIVGERARRFGAGRALLDMLSRSARDLSGAAPCVMAAEVLEPNPAIAFYSRVGYSPVAWNCRIDAQAGAAAPAGRYAARIAEPRDALAIARLEIVLAARRHASGDLRFDAPRGVDPVTVDAIAAHLASAARSFAVDRRDPETLVALDRTGQVRGVASFTVHSLEPPFLPLRRALIGRFALDPALTAAPLLSPLLTLGCKFALSRGVSKVELTDLSPPRTELYDAALAFGASAWSRVVTRSE
jgi:GNAT superfamily N-acetyltransferase